MARRFVIDGSFNVGEDIKISGDEARHIMVLRHNVGDEILINDKICKINNITKQDVLCTAIGVAEEKGVPETKITLFQALLKSDKMEFVIQKAVELGVHEVVPFFSKNVVVKLDEKDKIKKFERWNKISVEASKQCGRSDIVEVTGVCNFNEMLDKLNDFDIVIIAYENETKKLKEVIKGKYKVKNIAVIIGAEGGFDKCEVEKVLEKSNASSVSLGDRILRAETASLNLISILMYEFEM